MKFNKKNIFIALGILVLLFSGVIFYLNKVVLPVKVKSLLIKSIEEATGSKVELRSLSLNIFKGLVLRDLTLSDGQRVVFSLKEGSCTFLEIPFFKKTIIFPQIQFKSPVLYLERLPDKTLNLAGVFKKIGSFYSNSKSQHSNIIVDKIKIINGKIDFRDNSLSPAFTKSINSINADIYISLPADIKYRLNCAVDSKSPILAQGKYNILANKLVSVVNIKNISPVDFQAYLNDLKFNLPDGTIDAVINIDSIGDTFTFNNKINFYGLPIEAKVLMKGSPNPLFNIDVSGIDFTVFESFLKDKFKFSIPVKVSGRGNLLVVLDKSNFNGYLDFDNASISSDKFAIFTDGINGKLKFTNENIIWDNLKFNYLGTTYATTGVVSQFMPPQVELKLFSQDLAFDSKFGINGLLIEFTKFDCKYLNSKVSLTGDIDFSDPKILDTNIIGTANLSLQDLKKPLRYFAKILDKMNPSGVVDSRFSLVGNVKDFRTCTFEAGFSSPEFSLYGLKAQDLSVGLKQKDGIFNISSANMSFYDGKVDVTGAINLIAESMPYWLNLNIKDTKIEKLKLDTPAKGKDISGTVQAQSKLNGFVKDMSKFNGSGEISINNGRLWELNLFQGLGKAIFAKEFERVVFTEGYCGFTIRDQYLFSNALRLKSDTIELNGTAKIGLDGSIDSTIKICPLGQTMPFNNDISKIAQALIGTVDNVGTINITGTLTQAKYKYQAPVVDIINDLKNSFFNKVFNN